MKHIRIGKDIRLQWTITTDGAAIPLEGRDLTLEMKSPIGKVIILPYRVDGNVLTSLDLSNFDTSSVTNMVEMFCDCTSLTSIDLSNFDTHAVTDINNMFNKCQSLTSLDLSNFDTSSVTNMRQVFLYCTSLTSIDLSNFDTSLVTGIHQTFITCYSITSLLLGPNFFKTSAVTSIDFSSCSKWTNETVVTSLVTNSYDRAAAGLNTLTIKLHAKTKAALTDEQKATITSKGYTIA